MKIYRNENVFEAGLKRINYLFDEFENIVVGYSGGKDSTIILHLALMVAEQRNRLPLKVLFIDQEAEWQGTIDLVKEVMYDTRVEPYWYQIPMVITNNTSSFERYSKCWDITKKDVWVHQQDPISKKENKFGTERFHELFEKIFAVEFAGQKSCYLSGVRAEESPKRLMSLTDVVTYKWITWGKLLSKKHQHYTFYPIYDWSYTDVWKCIFENKWNYNRVYDEFYKQRVPLNSMRISNVHHETAIQSLLLIQEIEPQTWNKISARIEGANTVKHLKENSFVCPKDLPPAFTSWKEYSEYLIENIIQEDQYRVKLRKRMLKNADIYTTGLIEKNYFRTIINTILSSDWDFTKLANFEIRQETNTFRQFKKGVYKREMIPYAKYLTPEEKDFLINKILEQEK
jgi:predicted phosphoadenosine phosphosulfate sulfurtransferase